MTIVNLPVACRLGKAEILHALNIFAPHVGEMRGDEVVLLSRLLPDFIEEMQFAHYPRPGFVDYALVGELLSGTEYATRGDEGGMEIGGKRTPRLLGTFPDPFQLGLDDVRLSTDGYPPVRKRTRCFKRFRPVRRGIDRNVVVEVDEVPIAVDELDLPSLATVRVIDRVAVQQRPHNS